MRTRLALVIFAIFVSRLAAQSSIELPTEITVGSNTYSGCAYAKSNAAYLSFNHDAGIARVPIADLEPSIQQMLSYDPAKAKEEIEAENAANIAAASRRKAEAEKAQEEKELAAKAEAADAFLFEVTDTTKDGILAYLSTDSLAAWKFTGIEVLLVGHPASEKFARGDKFIAIAYQDGLYQEDEDSPKLRKYQYVSESRR